jgi:hypothetical protein
MVLKAEGRQFKEMEVARSQSTQHLEFEAWQYLLIALFWLLYLGNCNRTVFS